MPVTTATFVSFGGEEVMGIPRNTDVVVNSVAISGQRRGGEEIGDQEGACVWGGGAAAAVGGGGGGGLPRPLTGRTQDTNAALRSCQTAVPGSGI